MLAVHDSAQTTKACLTMHAFWSRFVYDGASLQPGGASCSPRVHSEGRSRVAKRVSRTRSSSPAQAGGPPKSSCRTSRPFKLFGQAGGRSSEVKKMGGGQRKLSAKKTSLRTSAVSIDMPTTKGRKGGRMRLKRAMDKYPAVFSGSGRVAKWLRKKHKQPCVAVDVRHGLRVNLLSKGTIALLKRCIAKRKVLGIWFGTPCSTFSLARRGRGGSPGGPLRLIGKYIKGHPRALLRPKDRMKIVTGNRLADCTAALAKHAHKNGVLWCIENPGNSRLWHYPSIAALARRPNVHRRLADMCAYHRQYKKPTAVLVGHGHGSGLERRCAGCDQHWILQGSNRTQQAQTYPDMFAKEAASLLAQSAV